MKDENSKNREQVVIWRIRCNFGFVGLSASLYLYAVSVLYTVWKHNYSAIKQVPLHFNLAIPIVTIIEKLHHRGNFTISLPVQTAFSNLDFGWGYDPHLWTDSLVSYIVEKDRNSAFKKTIAHENRIIILHTVGKIQVYSFFLPYPV